MKTKFSWLVLLLLAAVPAFATLSADQIYKLNHMNKVASDAGLGTAVGALEANSSVVTARIGDAAVTYPKIADANVITSKIADSAVSSAKIADSAVSEAKLGDYGSVGNGALRYARFIYDVSSGDYGSSTVNSGAHSLGVKLPAKAVIYRTWFQIVTPFVGGGTVAFSCEDANNILTAEDLTNDSAGFKAGNASTGDIAQFTGGIANECWITATVAGVDQTAGRLVGWVLYLIGE